MATATPKEFTLTLSQLLAICTALVLPGLAGFYAMRERVVVLESWKAEQITQKAELNKQLGEINENVVLMRIQMGRLFPAPAPTQP